MPLSGAPSGQLPSSHVESLLCISLSASFVYTQILVIYLFLVFMSLSFDKECVQVSQNRNRDDEEKWLSFSFPWLLSTFIVTPCTTPYRGIPVHNVLPCASNWFVFSPHYPLKTNKGEWVQISLFLTREAMGRESVYLPLILWTLSEYQLSKEIILNIRALFSFWSIMSVTDFGATLYEENCWLSDDLM